jgi:lysyl-tRNA synthetase class 2
MPSNVIRHFTYDAHNATLDVEFVSGRRYRYHDVPDLVAEAMRAAFAKGEFFNANIRDRFRFTRLDASDSTA